MNCGTVGLLMCIISGIFKLITQPKHEFVQGKSCASLASPLTPTHSAEVLSPGNTAEAYPLILPDHSLLGANALEMGLHPMGYSILSFQVIWKYVCQVNIQRTERSKAYVFI